MKEEKILVLCPSRGRPKQFKAMAESFLKTQEMSTLRLLLDMCDPCLDEYRDTMPKDIPYIIEFRQPITKLINNNWEFSAECYKWFSVTNDDFIYKTERWDKKLTDRIKEHRLGIAYGNDLMQNVNMPTTSVVSREIVEELGWLQMPRLTHLFGDEVWKYIGQEANCLYYLKDVIIEHRHYFNKKAEQDTTYKETNNRAMYDKDGLAFHIWKTHEGINEIARIISLVDKNNRKPAIFQS